MFNFLKNKGNSAVSEMSDSNKLLNIVNIGVLDLEIGYKNLSDKGKFEVLIFNSLIALQEYRNKYPSKYDKVEKDLLISLFNSAKTYQVNYTSEKLIDFVNSRLSFYASEINLIRNNGHTAGRLYTAFYVNPLCPNPSISLELTEVMRFYSALVMMWKAISFDVVAL